ncbi:MAG: hypothetical protein ONB48_07250 [candidate division KSB1 bacterium]|nr:hypothetical protein [candidate division KSB1 bacterium]MDZ7274616.1 hypothetical protein [candidate division KSB1 bacterium]MDZ7285441.1 hypothetical protein [candidate division KSB1 bacterium]MDZ7298473.1 hypothetical protein [candidate division KSB1 bacterium]MDZ7306957.1 hypothetical protein [candidate division KSB1 bacterium]
MILKFPQTHNPWVDAGLVGFVQFVELDMPADVTLRLLPDRLELEGEKEALKSFLEKQFQRLVQEWYNASSAKQKEELSGYYFDPVHFRFQRFGKSLPKGLAALLFDAAARDYEGPNWDPKKDCDGKSGQETSRLDPGEAREWARKAGLRRNLQDMLDEFLLESGLWQKGKARPKSGTKVMLWGRPNLRIPDVEVWAEDAKTKGVCSISGEPVGARYDIDGKNFPFTVGKSGHVNFTPDWQANEKIGWKTAYLSLFAPVIGFWQGGHGDPHLIGALPVASDLVTLQRNVRYLQSMLHDDPSLQGNFEIKLKALRHSKEPEERFVAFFERLFHLTLQTRHDEPLEDFSEYEFFTLPQEINNGAPTAFLLIEAHKSAKWDIKHAEVYQDPIYLLRLFSRMYVRAPQTRQTGIGEEGEAANDDQHWQHVQLNFSRFLQQLWDPTRYNKRGGQDGTPPALLTRRLVLRHMLGKKRVLPVLVAHAYSINRESGKTAAISELLKFAEIYEPLFWSKDMIANRDQFLKAAKELGEHVAIVVHQHDNGRKNRLYKLRRALTLPDFLRELNTLQERFGLTVPDELTAGLLAPQNYDEFRGFCLLSALNKFNKMSFAKSKQGA